MILQSDTLTRGYSLTEFHRDFDTDMPEESMLCTVISFDFQGTEWTMILSVPESTVMRNISDLSNRWLLGMAAILALAMVYATLKLRVWISYRDLLPVRRPCHEAALVPDARHLGDADRRARDIRTRVPLQRNHPHRTLRDERQPLAVGRQNTVLRLARDLDLPEGRLSVEFGH